MRKEIEKLDRAYKIEKTSDSGKAKVSVNAIDEFAGKKKHQVSDLFANLDLWRKKKAGYEENIARQNLRLQNLSKDEEKVIRCGKMKLRNRANKSIKSSKEKILKLEKKIKTTESQIYCHLTNTPSLSYKKIKLQILNKRAALKCENEENIPAKDASSDSKDNEFEIIDSLY